ncbi:pterin-4-alpha-carbinolamine dehydratase [Xylanimonas oleitrophica]|uniref:Putative pterin-4-alpha-carbinolamine dehydratase n=1 Tax=Xylanimonas oleitrophica TaxID=2607479 RepID=A0A2W5WKH8_9MICO|nr:VOC family protein [Xylanimonas oleitrophica]PZR51562.1 pterin-4-alpha-carbinolamine dehydratase [Xylanimonas oleitrophica]
MDDRITPEQFQGADGTGDWRSLGPAYALFRTGTFQAGARLVARIAEVADELGRHPDVDLRGGTVTVRLGSHEVGGLSARDVELARRISAAAAGMGVEADPSGVQQTQLGVDALAGGRVQPFWRALLGYDERPGEEAVREEEAAPSLVDPRGRGLDVWFPRGDSPRTEHNRLHLDVFVPDDVAQERVEAALAAGGHLVTDRWAPSWWVLADPEGNEAAVCTWQEPPLEV